MSWNKVSLGQILGPSGSLLNELSHKLTILSNEIQIIRFALTTLLNNVLSRVNKINAIVNALQASGFYVISLSPAKGSWSNRLNFAPNAPPEGNYHCTTGVCVILTAPSLDDSIKNFETVLTNLQGSVTTFSPSRVKNRPPDDKQQIVREKKLLDEWHSATLSELLPSISDLASEFSTSGIGFMAGLQHALDTISLVGANASDVVNSATSFMEELSSTGAYAIMLPPKAMGIVERLTSEIGAPPRDQSMYTVGFCACFYALDADQCQTKYEELSYIFDPNISEYPEFVPGIEQKIKSWATPTGGFYNKEVYVVLECNIKQADIYYTLNGADPRTDISRLLYNPTIPIYINKNNTTLKHYAIKGFSTERITRSHLYRLVNTLPDIPYSSLYGVVSGVGVIQDTLIASFITPPNSEWGTEEHCLDPGFKHKRGFETGDSGNQILSDSGFPIGISETCDPISTALIPPDEPRDVPTVVLIEDMDYGQSTEEIIPLSDSGSMGSIDTWYTDNSLNTPYQGISNTVTTSQDIIYNTLCKVYLPDTLKGYSIRSMTPSSIDAMGLTISEDKTYITGMVTFFSALTLTLSIGENLNSLLSSVIPPIGSVSVIILGPQQVFPIADYSYVRFVLIPNQEDYLTISKLNALQSAGASNTKDKLVYSILPMNGVSTLFYPSGNHSLSQVLSDISSDNIIIGESIKLSTLNINSLFIDPSKITTGEFIKITLIPRAIPESSLTTEYSPICTNLYFNVGDGPTTITLIAENTKLPMGNSSMGYLIIDEPTKGVLSGVSPNLIYTKNLGEGGVDSFTYIAKNEKALSSLATVTLKML